MPTRSISTIGGELRDRRDLCRRPDLISHTAGRLGLAYAAILIGSINVPAREWWKWAKPGVPGSRLTLVVDMFISGKPRRLILYDQFESQLDISVFHYACEHHRQLSPPRSFRVLQVSNGFDPAFRARLPNHTRLWSYDHYHWIKSTCACWNIT